MGLKVQVVRIDAEQLQIFIKKLLLSEGVPTADADYVAWHLVETDLRGTYSHGVARLTHYLRRLRVGSINAKPVMRFERKDSALGILDGDHGLGHAVMRRAADEAAALALEAGAGWVSIRNSSHCGALAPFALRLAKRGMVALVFTHADPLVLPQGALEAFCGTNPICFAAPGVDNHTICLDMATSIVPWNAVMNAQIEGRPIPSGWGVTEQGEDTSDPGEVKALYPSGGYKGAGLGIMIDVLCAMFSGAPYGPDIPKMYGNLEVRRNLGGLVGAINISAFTNLDIFKERVVEMTGRLGQLKRSPKGDGVYYPGQRELEAKERQQVEGIPIGLQVFAELNALASVANIPQLKPMKSSV